MTAPQTEQTASANLAEKDVLFYVLNSTEPQAREVF